MFNVSASRVVDFASVRIVLTRPGTTTIVLDTTVTFPTDSSSIRVPLSVILDAGVTSEDLDLSLALVTAAKDTIFRGGPVRVTATAGVSGGVVPDVPLRYVGIGANADSVHFVTTPARAFFGDTAVFAAAAFDSSGQPIPGTPIIYGVNPLDSTTAAVPDPSLGRVVAKAKRGPARVTATLLTGQTASATLLVQPKAASVVVTGGNSQSAAASASLPLPVVVQVKAADGAGVSAVTVNFAVTSGGGNLTVPSAVSDTGGFASVGWTLGGSLGPQTMTATVTGLTPATATATATGPGILLTVPGNLVGAGGSGLLLVKLAPAAPSGGLTVTVTSDSTQYLTVAPPGTVAFAAGDTLKSIVLTGVAPGVSVLHATATGYFAGTIPVAVTPNLILLQQSVTVGIGQSTNLGIQLFPAAPAGGLVVTLASTDTTKLKVTTPTVTIPATQTTGNATIQGVAGGLAAVIATATGYAPGGAAVTIAGAATTLALFSGGGQVATAGTQLPQPVIVKVSDALGNGVAGVAVTFAVATGGGSVGTPNATTNVVGLATTTWTLGGAAGQQTITATATGLTGSPLTVTANPTGVIASTTMTPKLDTLTSLTATFQLAAQAKDAGNNNLTGNFTWVSRAPAVATVSASGLVTAVTNGSSYVVATETGGTTDSALIVVQQKLASVSVTPANRSIYLGANFNFTAAAVDGLGKPMPGVTAFTWSTTAPAVATVDTAGHVAGVGIGTAQIKAMSGSITGVANVSILTQVTRIAVVVDTVGAAQTDTFSLPSLGVTRRYRAIAHDTLDAPMSGALFKWTWASSNPSVAGVANDTTDTATVTSAANGVTSVKATAQGFTSTPGALLTVSQVLASIQLSPATATIAVTGTVGLTARGLDANARYISGGSFTYVSKTPAIATVGATSGIVTGVALGADTVTADSGAIVSNPSVILVANTGVPPIISFGRDTVSVGRGGNASIPVLLSTPVPVGGPSLTVNLGVSPAAWAHWSTASVTIPVGGVSTNATLVGDSAGTTTVTATDGSSLGYAAASAVAKVTANMRLTSGSYAINATDIASTQVLLSDPSPAGGTYVTYAYGTPGVAAVSPDPAFIPAGQLAADIQIRALAAGTTSITPRAIGVNGTVSNFIAYAPVLTLNGVSPVLLGLGQYSPNIGYVYLPTSTNLALPVTLTSSDTTVATITPVVTIAANSNYNYYTITSRGLGRAANTPSASGWTAANTDSVIVTTPRVAPCCGGTIYTTSGIQNLAVYSEDSTRNSHYRVNSLVVNVRSSDATVMRVIDSIAIISPGNYYVGGVRVTPGALGGTAYVVATAGGHTPDSVFFTVNGPPLAFSWSSRVIGAGQQDNNAYVYTPNNELTPLVVKLSNTDPTRVAVPDSVVIPVGTNYVYFSIQGVVPGAVTIGATATGYQSTSATVTVSTPTIIANGNFTFNNFNPGANLTVYSADTLRSAHTRIASDTVSIVVRNSAVVTVDSAAVIIPAGQYYNNQAHITPVAPGSTYIVFTANGQTVLDSLAITVNTPPIYFNFGTVYLGRRQHLNPSGNGFYVYTPDSRSVPVPTTIAQKHASDDSISTLTPTILASSNYVYADIFGTANGTDTLTVSATGYTSPQAAYVIVSTPKLASSGLPGSTTTTNPPIGVNIYAEDSIGNGRYTMDTVVVHAVSSDTTVIRPDSAYYHLVKNTYYLQRSVTVVGPGSASITYSDSANSGYQPVTTNTVTVTGPSLAFNTASIVLGMRQTNLASNTYVYTPNSVATPVVVHLKSTDTLVVTVPDSVIIPAASNYIFFPVTGRDTLGTIQVQATATGYSAAAMNVQVTRPKFVISTSSQLNTTSGRSAIYVYAEDANGSTHYTTDSVVVNLVSSATSVAQIDSTSVTIPKGAYYVNTATWGPNPTPTPGTAQLTATDNRAALYAYSQAQYNVTVIQPSLNFNWGTQTLGLGQYNNEYVYTPDNAPGAPINVTLAHTGTARTGTTINGAAVSTVQIPTGLNYVYFHVVGSAVGWDTLGASATSPPFFPATGYTAVSQGHMDPIVSWPSALKLSGTDSVQILLYARDSTGTVHNVQDSTTFTLAPNAFIQFTANGGTGPITSVVIPKDQDYVYLWVKGLAQGDGQAQISATNYVTYNTPVITVSP